MIERLNVHIHTVPLSYNNCGQVVHICASLPGGYVVFCIRLSVCYLIPRTLGPFSVFILLDSWICLHGVLD